MSQPSSTGSFWRCPTCGRHVPMRLSACRCGFDRNQSNQPILESRVTTGGPQAAEGQGPSFTTIGLSVLGLSLLAVSAYIARDAWNGPRPEDTPLARRIRCGQAPPAPQIAYVPMPVRSQTLGATREGGTPPTGATASPSLLTEAAVPIRHPTSVAPPSPAPEWEIDVKRRLGTEEFERQMRALSVKADQADIAFERFFAGCRREVAFVTAVAGVADRDWVAFADGLRHGNPLGRSLRRVWYFSLACQAAEGRHVPRGRRGSASVDTARDSARPPSQVPT